MRSLEEHYDVVVCGGGLAGICAAIASARGGARTCIIQDRPVFGGNSSSEIRVFPQGAANFHAYARETGIISELLIEERAVNHEPNRVNGRTNSVWDLLLYDKIMETEGLSFHLNTSIHAVEKGPDGELQVIRARVAHAETELALHANLFIDCTGDGIVAALSGCEWRMGSEGRDEFGEPHAPESASGDVMGSSIHFRAKNMGRPVPYQAPKWAVRYDDPDFFYKGGRLADDPEGGFWWIELGVPWNTIEENETIRHELTSHVLGIWDFMKNKDPEMKEKAANYALDWIGAVPGKRESRRIMGQYVLTELDLLNPAPFGDEIGYGGWYIDLHKAGGLLAEYSEQAVAEGEGSSYMRKSYVPPFGIPLRCLLSKDVPNLLMAGRNISVTHAALGSTRVMGTTAVLGQAAGTTAAVLIARGEQSSNVSAESVRDIKQILLKEGAFLLHTRNEDEADLARQATAKASGDFVVTGAEPFVEAAHAAPIADELRLTERRAQWIAVHSPVIDELSLYVVNRAEETRYVDVALRSTGHLWDYHCRADDVLAHDRLEIPARYSGWLTWPLRLTFEDGANRRYVRLEAGPNEDIAWIEAENVLPGMTAAFDMGEGMLRRYGNGSTLSFRISPAQRPYPASLVLSGVTRPYDDTNMWRSQTIQDEAEGAWIELEWAQPVAIREVQLVFPGHLLRDYRFQPPLSRDGAIGKQYDIYACEEGQWVWVHSETDNYQARRTHVLPRSYTADKLRIVVRETNGDPCAMMGEIRVYA
ncbi:FAD-dependent oxidoreductase [Paenibacillus sp. strain BS8-2]